MQNVKKLGTSRRGYGTQHQALRSRLERVVAAGQAVCGGPNGCGERIHPGEKWDLGHHPLDRSLYVGPQHARCNRRTAQKAKNSRHW